MSKYYDHQIILDKNHVIVKREKKILTFIPFQGVERKCWECRGVRNVVIAEGFSGDLLYFNVVCESPNLRLHLGKQGLWEP